MTTCLLTATLATSARGADDAPPPGPMQGGVAVALDRPGAGVERTKVGDAPALTVRGKAGRKTTSLLATIEKPGITSIRYAVKGWIRYDGVEGDGFVELWNHFGEQAYFSRTLGDAGPMAKVTGDSGWRVFFLPFTANEGMTPDKLTLSLVLPGVGTATVTDVRLVDFGAAASQPTTAAVVVAPKIEIATGRPSWFAVVAGAVAGLAAALVAIAVGVAISVRARMRRTATAAELRRMQALDSA